MSGFSSLGKRLEQLERAIRFRSPRIIVITVPTDASTGKPSAETEAATAELHRLHAVTDDDLVVHVANYSDDVAPPQLVSIQQQI
jgi:hypothetical protein